MSQLVVAPRGSSQKWTAASSVGAIVSALLASACCVGPLLFAVLGVGSGALFVRFEAYRPYLIMLTVGLIGLGFFFTYRKPKAAEGEACGCELPKANRVGKIMLWVATVVVALSLLFPFLSATLLG